MYFITSVNKNDTRCVGYYSNIEKAIDVVKHNIYDLNESGYYPYVVIEHIVEGIYQYDYDPLWYEFDEDDKIYKEISQPPFASEPSIGYALG